MRPKGREMTGGRTGQRVRAGHVIVEYEYDEYVLDAQDLISDVVSIFVGPPWS